MKKLFPLLILTGLITLLACGSYQRTTTTTEEPEQRVTAEPQSERVVPYPIDAVWTALIDLFEARNWTIDSQDRKAGRIATLYFDLGDGSSYCGCRGGRRSTLSDYRGQLAVLLKRVTANGTNVKISSECDALDTGSRGQQARIDCSSNGRLETEVFAGIDSVMAAR
jgi:hypothetical protein